MSRLSIKAISQELRQLAAAYPWTSFSPASLPTGRDPRLATKASELPQIIIQAASSIAVPKGIGGHMMGYHGFAMFVVFKYPEDADIAEMKMDIAEEMLDWLATNKAGTSYQVHLVGGDSSPTVDYNPTEERAYDAGSRTALVKLEFAVSQPTLFQL